MQAMAAAPAPFTTTRILSIFLRCSSKRIQQGSTTDDGCSMLIIVHYRNAHLLAQFLFNVKTFGRFYVLEVNAPKSGFKGLYNGYKLFRVFFIDFDIKNINICEIF
jgi:hypothetical protein